MLNSLHTAKVFPQVELNSDKKFVYKVKSLLEVKLSELKKDQLLYRVPKKKKIDLLITVLAFPNVRRAIKVLTFAVEKERMEWGFRIWKNLKNPLTRRELQLILNIKKSENVLIIQRSFRGMLGRLKVIALRQHLSQLLSVQKDLKATGLRTLLQHAKFKKNIRRLQLRKLTSKKEHAARVIQRYTRGYFGRGIVNLMSREQLITVLRRWGNGSTAALMKRPALQDKSSQLYLEVILSVSQCSSRPLKNLPSIVWINECVVTILKLMQIEEKYSEVKQREYVTRQFERLRMISEDKKSILICKFENRRRLEIQAALANSTDSAHRDRNEKSIRAQQISEARKYEENRKMMNERELMKIEDWRSHKLFEYR
jgi:hypothetical protein